MKYVIGFSQYTGNLTTPEQHLSNKQNITEQNKTKQIDIYSEQARECLDYLNQLTGRQFKKSSELNARLKEYSIDDIKRVIERQSQKWMGDAKMQPYLRPKTLFAVSNFEGYLNASKQGIPNENTIGHQDSGISDRGDIAAKALDLLDY